MAGIVIKPRARILHGHDWVFSSEVLKVFGNPVDGDVISLKDGKDHLIGSAIYNSKAWSSRSIFCADIRPVCISIKSIITGSSRVTLATGAFWIALQIRAHLHWSVRAQAQRK